VKILWVKSDFLHPTTKGGQIRTLEMLRRIHAAHELHYVAFTMGADQTTGPSLAHEYSTKAYPIPLDVPSKTSPRFLPQLARGVFSPVPVAVDRYRSAAMRRTVEELQQQIRFDLMICDFLVPSINIRNMEAFVLFQHNVETVIWQRHTEQAQGGLKRWYMGRQAQLMERYEREICRKAKHVVAVSETDAVSFQEMFGVPSSVVATGVDVEYFAKPAAAKASNWDLIFLGSMDWLPNIQGVEQFFEKILPLIRKKMPSCRMAVVGRDPTPGMRRLGEKWNVHITGTVPDVRPYLWESKVSVVPLYIGGGTRLKIYECMAAGVAVVSTAIGAEGLAVEHGQNIRIADTPEAFAQDCLNLLENDAERERIAGNALQLVRERFSWENVASSFLAGIAAGTSK
jgi:glycosyltransferase involved in cell wall biosynthesis